MFTLFGNTGKKIKTLAVVMLFIGFFVSLFGWIVLMANGAAKDEVNYIYLGLVVLVIGTLASWVNSIFIYGFGVLVDSSERTAENTSPDLEPGPPYDSLD